MKLPIVTRRRAEDHCRVLAAQVDELTAANQSYDKPVR